MVAYLIGEMEVDDPEGERVVGADDGQVGAMFQGEAEQGVQVLGADGNAFDAAPAAGAALLLDAGIARGTP